ncbi:Argonaute-like protein [Favolaschia claudopus]|uniref:Argonaute-like protein n=1 Tax=Favolaschia claudopus TaxID=2862362 RepID=A0AAW0BDK6_9AGAR
MAGVIDVKIRTNAFEITQLPTKKFYQYDIIFRPEIPIANKRERVMHNLQVLVAPTIFHPRGVFDGTRLLYISHTLNLPGGSGGASFTVRLGSDPNAPVGSPGVFQVLISKTASDVIRPSDLQQLIAGPNQVIGAKAATAMNLLQLLIRQTSNQNHPTNNGRAFFSDGGKKVISGGIELWRGFYQSVRPTMGRMVVQIDTMMASVYESGPLINVAMHVLGARSVRDLGLNDERDPAFRKLVAHFHRRLITTVPTQAKTKTIHGLIRGPIGRYTFTKDGRATTIQDYFRDVHNIPLTYPNTFGVLISGRSAPFPVIIPAELCKIIPGQLYKKRLPPTATSDAVDFATMRPQDRLRAIAGVTNSGLQSPLVGYRNSEYVHDAGMVVDVQPISLSAKLLAPPAMKFHGNDVATPDNGSWNVVKRKFKKPRTLNTWAVVNFATGRVTQELLQRGMHELISVCRNIGMTVQNPQHVRYGDGANPEKVLDEIRHTINAPIDLIIVVLPQDADAIRTRVKHWGDVMHGIRTSCLRQDKFLRANNQYWMNVAIKLNARLGGQYASPQTFVLSELQKAPFMICGADVAHPGPGSSKPSIASLVFSHDTEASSYIAYSQVQHPRLEIIAGLKEMMKTAIYTFGSNNPPPHRIIFYRDGVSEGEMERVKAEEIIAIRNACIELWEEMRSKHKIRPDLPLPKITFICVVKRHHAVFLPDDNTVDDHKTGNCRAGLVVDQLRSPLALDFYLQSHAAIKGTSRSGHYNILLDENFNNDVGMIQRLSFELCHVYAKATRSISIPAPVYYADMVCARAKFHFTDDIEASTNASGSEEFDLDFWQRAYQPVSGRSHYDKLMYFL